ncbi:MAG: c-type cytochrome [Actinobacteria bacterium]|nr:MAG: c-type cytochrome [Actinomycetota bacterium]
MKHRTTLVLGVALIGLGLAGMTAVWLLGSPAAPSAPRGGFASLGQQIYFTGADAAGPIPRAGGPSHMASARACVGCHGATGTGGSFGMMRNFEVPDIRYSALTSPHPEDDPPTPAWTDADIARAIRDGVEPNGESLDAFMPRWDMTDDDMNAVIAYLKELG